MKEVKLPWSEIEGLSQIKIVEKLKARGFDPKRPIRHSSDPAKKMVVYQQDEPENGKKK